MQWQDHLCIGAQNIDRHRRRLFEMVKALREALHTHRMYEVMGKALKFIVTYANTYFKTEEAYMTSIGFPRASTHSEQHDQLTRDIQEILLKIKQERHVSPAQLTEFMSDWLLNHTLIEDLKIKRYQDQTKREQAAARFQAYADTRSMVLETLKQIDSLFNKETITREAYLAKKTAVLDAFVQFEDAVPLDEIEQRISLIEMFLSRTLIDAEEERLYKHKLFENMDLDEELKKRPKIKAKINYLKSLLAKDLITEKLFHLYYAELTDEPSDNKPPDQDVIKLV